MAYSGTGLTSGIQRLVANFIEKNLPSGIRITGLVVFSGSIAVTTNKVHTLSLERAKRVMMWFWLL